MNQTKLSLAIAAMISEVAAAQGISKEQVSNGYTIAPTAVQIMYDEIAQNTELLQKINLRPKTEKVGEVIGLSSGLIGSNTDTTGAGKERKPKPIHNLSGRKYSLEKTNFDAALRYDEIDQWAHLTDFPKHVNKKIAESIALSLVTIGMNGTSRADDSDASANTMLQDVAKGWLQKMREENKARCIGTAGTSVTSVPHGPGATNYKNLDAVVTDALNIMDERFADRSDFVVLTSRRTVGDKYLRIVNKSGDTATEIEAGGRLNKERTLGGLPVMYVPNMPQNTLLITPLSNLSIYYQISGERRLIVDNPRKDQLESLQSKNIDFIVEEYGAAVLIENLKYTE
nr:P2 family phage major capsid protein [uncultured Neisseria sp.]DAN55185.1 MAG TPA: major capsid protein [Bacteriophage sp.]